jgi:DNA helicase HerA-like ATPase
VDKLGLKRAEKDVVLSAVRMLIEEGESINREALYKKAEKVAETKVVSDKTRAKTLENIKWALDNKGGFIDREKEPLDIISQIRRTPITIVDYSVDTDIEAQQRTAAHIINHIKDYAMAQRSKGDFACIIAVEEAQYLAPEKGAEVKESSAQGEAKAAFIEAISQAGGYNVGLIVMTQRPAYVAKSVISQCNSVVCFRLKSGNDQEAIMNYTEYGSERLAEYLPGLADHEAMLWGMAVPTPFPLIAEMDVKEYPQKAAAFAKQAWERMEEKVEG